MSNSRSNLSAPTTDVRPELRTPIGGRPVRDDVPEFAWDGVDDAVGYRLQIAATPEFASLYFDAHVGDTTTINVYDVLPGHAATCFWRVEAERADGSTVASGVGHFATLKDEAIVRSDSDAEANASDASSASMHRAASLTRPENLSPTQGAPTPGGAAVFEWTPLPMARGYDLQVGATDDFGETVVELELDPTASLTLYGMLPDDGSTYYWRVRAHLPGADRTSDWSDAAAFTAATDEEVIVYEEEQQRIREEKEAMARAEDKATERERAEAESPVLTGVTSLASSLTIVYIAVLSFIVTIFLILDAM